MPEDTSETKDDDSDWVIIEGREVQEERYIRIPDDVQQAIQTQTIRGPTVFWNYEQNSHWIVLSRNPLSSEAYVRGEATQIQDPEEEWSRIRPPKSLGEMIISKFFAGNQMFYLARRGMIEDNNPTVYLLESTEFGEILDDYTTDDDEGDSSDIRKTLMNNPGFLPSPSGD